MDFIISIIVILKVCLFFSFYFVLLMVEGDWLKMLCRRKFIGLKIVDEEKVFMKVRNLYVNNLMVELN